jgi:hypothetical protein
MNGLASKANGMGEAVGRGTENLSGTTEYRAENLDWWRSLVDQVAGSDHGLLIGVISCIDGELVEVFGALPPPLKKGLHRCTGKRVRDCQIAWLTRPDGKGVRYELDGLGDFLGLLEERAELMQGGAE